jgi:dienelactone hydrolase
LQTRARANTGHDKLAAQGFIAAAPDLFRREEPGVDLNVTSETDWRQGLRLYQAYDRDAGVRDVKGAIGVVAKLPECTGKVAVLGYCLGALITFFFRLCATGSTRRSPISAETRRSIWAKSTVFTRRCNRGDDPT